MFGKLLHDAVWVGVGTVDLVDRNDDRHFGRLGVVDGLDCLRHDAIVGRHNQDDDVCDVGTTSTHGREGLVTRGVDEGDFAAVTVHLVGTNVLGDATGFAGSDVGFANLVQQRGLAVVDVTHDSDDRRTSALCGFVFCFFIVISEVLGRKSGFLFFTGVDQVDRWRRFRPRKARWRRRTQRLRGGDHFALLQQETNDISSRAVELGTKVLRS